jgi:asparagine synthetase B (glutamine-hydrolysing)
MNINLDLIARQFADVEFFLACVFPDTAPQFGPVPSTLAVASTSEFWAVSSRAPSNGRGLLHEVAGSQLAFRGYEAALGVHSYSDPAILERIAAPDALQNGAFAYLKFDPQLQQAMVRNDAFGFGPMYYRQRGGTWFFASHPVLLHLAGDAPDLGSWVSLMHNGSAMDGRSFFQDIKRFQAWAQMTIRRDGADTQQWFDVAQLPPGEEMIDDKAFRIVEDAYLAAMERCLKLDVGEVTLPFSSGFDSRRFFATLLRKAVPFKAVTCQTFHRKNGRDYDIDSYFAPKIAAAFGVDCELVRAVPPSGIEAEQARRQALIGTETFMHGWALPFMRWLAKRPPSLVFDGLAGDTFGNSGFEIDGLHETPEKDAELVLEKSTGPFVLQQLSSRFPSGESFRRHYRAFLAQFPPNLNQAELAFLQSRTRRCISPWITMMHPPGHVVVFPYCDLEFAIATLKYHPAEKYKYFFQKECLLRFYPEFYDFHGSRNLPADHPPLDQATSRARDEAQERYAYGDAAVTREALGYLNWPNKLVLLASRLIPGLRPRRHRLFRPLLLLVRTYREAPAFIELDTRAQAARQAGQAELTEPTTATRG